MISFVHRICPASVDSRPAVPLRWYSLFRKSTRKMEQVDTSVRLSKLRELMRDNKVDIYGKNLPLS